MPLIRAANPETTLDPAVGGTPDRYVAVREAARARRAAPLIALLADAPDPLLREAAMTALARLGDAEAVAALVGAVGGEDIGLRNGAIETLAWIGEAAIDALAPLIADADPHRRISALTVLEGIALPRCAEIALKLALVDPHVNVCVAAVEVVAACGAPEMEAALRTVPARFPDNDLLGFAVRTAIRRLG
jgi:HEAT repeat protein